MSRFLYSKHALQLDVLNALDYLFLKNFIYPKHFFEPMQKSFCWMKILVIEFQR